MDKLKSKLKTMDKFSASNIPLPSYHGSFSKYVYTKKSGKTIDFYGTIREDSNFEIICENEYDDGIVADIDATIHNTAKKVCDYLVENYDGDVVEVVSC